MNVILCALGLSYAGMASLSLAMDRHHGQVWGRDAAVNVRRVLQLIGAVLLALAIWPCVAGWSATVGFVAWVGFISAGALLVALLLPYAPKLLLRSSLLAAVAALAGLVTFLQ
ncbi:MULTISPECIES: DUF3325 domain-containing protein [unclassified Janthinobacterium]|uniref:DUF3325 domain-containing protein n=1 Tax=unclassified Janthinobacterium TaxID=2610881 RepID=UPI0016209408|nr:MULTISPECIES: DUF3325 domain-containing protein [unclassified Janthinobacterium]MBB5367940.1 hypothetical protein [Janthinobacterium sp. K2C7]MBB5379582.1 hypothetical protein [Janthinobacterium sp. K2Li3]MBB5386322.1 hypothetical protein [Janthinobacterium sp. K2E3]